MPKPSSPDRAWVGTEIDASMAEAFRERAAAGERSVAQELRLLIRRHLKDDVLTVSSAVDAPHATLGRTA